MKLYLISKFMVLPSFSRLFNDTQKYSSIPNFLYRIFQLHIDIFEYSSYYIYTFVYIFIQYSYAIIFLYLKTMFNSDSNLPLLQNEKKLQKFYLLFKLRYAETAKKYFLYNGKHYLFVTRIRIYYLRHFSKQFYESQKHA